MKRLVLLLLVSAAILFALANFNRAQQLFRLEGAVGALLHFVTGGGDTLYGAGFADGRFLQVRNGMTERDVVALLGEPLNRYGPEANHSPPSWNVGMRWSRSANDSHYSVRVVLFNDGRVVDRHSEFYVD